MAGQSHTECTLEVEILSSLSTRTPSGKSIKYRSILKPKITLHSSFNQNLKFLSILNLESFPEKDTSS